MRYPLDLSPLSVLELPAPDFVACAAEAGYASVSLRLLPTAPHEPYYNLLGDSPLARATARRLEETGLKVLETEGLPIFPDSRVANFMPVLEATARFGASKLVMVSRDPDAGRFADTFAMVCDQASVYGIEVVLEFMPVSCIKTLDAAIGMVRRIDRRNVGIALDVLHFVRSGSTLDSLREAGDLVRVVHFCDVPEGPAPGSDEDLTYEMRCTRLAPGAGRADLPGLLSALPKDVAFTLEIPDDVLRLRLAPLDRMRLYREAAEKVLAASGRMMRA